MAAQVGERLETARIALGSAADWTPANAARPALSGFTAEWLNPAELPAIWPQCRALEAKALENNAFFSSTFLEAALRHIPAAAPRLLAIWQTETHGIGRRLTGLFPLSAPSGWTGSATLRGWSHPFVATGTPLLDRTCARQTLNAALDAAAATKTGPMALQFALIDQNGPFAALLREVAADRGLPLSLLDAHSRAALIGTAATPDDKRRNKERRRQQRRLSERGLIGFEVIEDYNEFRIALEDFLTLEASGWKGRNRTALIQNPSHANFTRAMLWSAARLGKARIARLTLDGRTIASGILLIEGRGARFWKIAFCESHAAFSPGALLALELAGWMAADSGLERIDSCAIPGHRMIESVWTGRIEVADVIIGLDPARTPAYQAAVARERLRRSLRARLKRIVNRLRGRG